MARATTDAPPEDDGLGEDFFTGEEITVYATAHFQKKSGATSWVDKYRTVRVNVLVGTPLGDVLELLSAEAEGHADEYGAVLAGLVITAPAYYAYSEGF